MSFKLFGRGKGWHGESKRHSIAARKAIVRKNPRTKSYTVLLRNPHRIGKFGEWKIKGSGLTKREAQNLKKKLEGRT